MLTYSGQDNRDLACYRCGGAAPCHLIENGTQLENQARLDSGSQPMDDVDLDLRVVEPRDPVSAAIAVEVAPTPGLSRA